MVGEKTGKDDEFVRMVTEQNVRTTVKDTRERSPILRGMEDQRKIKIVDAVYDMETGTVNVLDE